MTVEAIKDAIIELPDGDRGCLAAWLNGLDHDDWDKQMVADFSPSGRGVKLVEQVNCEIREGNAVSFEEGRQQAMANLNVQPP